MLSLPLLRGQSIAHDSTGLLLTRLSLGAQFCREPQPGRRSLLRCCPSVQASSPCSIDPAQIRPMLHPCPRSRMATPGRRAARLTTWMPCGRHWRPQPNARSRTSRVAVYRTIANPCALCFPLGKNRVHNVPGAAPLVTPVPPHAQLRYQAAQEPRTAGARAPVHQCRATQGTPPCH